MTVQVSAALFLFLLLLPALPFVSPAAENDVRCVRNLKQSLGDPDGRLDWNFSNNTVGFICSFSGISCWNPQENRILSVTLSSRSLTGTIPPALQFCRGVTTLDLSDNLLSGAIPTHRLRLASLFAASRSLRQSPLRPHPPELSNCIFLNTLVLSSNSLSGQIPASLSRTGRLKELELSNNRLTGEIPPSLAASFPSSSFDSNDGLCGQPISSRCGSHSHTGFIIIIIIAAGVSGALSSLALVYFVSRCCFSY